MHFKGFWHWMITAYIFCCLPLFVACQKESAANEINDSTKHKIAVTINRIPQSVLPIQLNIFQYQLDNFKMIDSIVIDITQFQTSIALSSSNGLYAIQIEGGIKSPFIVGNEQLFQIKANYHSLAQLGDISIRNSEENSRYKALQEFFTISNQIWKLVFKSQQLGLNQEEIDSLYHYIPFINDGVDSVCTYTDLFSCKVIAPQLKLPIKISHQEIEMLSDFWNTIPLYHPQILNSYHLQQLLNHYLLSIRTLTKKDQIVELEEWYSRLNFDAEVKQFTRAYIIDYYLRTKQPDMAKAFASYSADGCLDELTEYIDLNYDQLMGLTLNTSFPSFTIAFRNKNYDNKKLIGTSSFLYLIVWKPGCQACINELKTINQNLDALKRENITVAGICLTDNEQQMNEVLRNLDIQWLNISDLKGLSSHLISELKISSTPSTFLVDHQLNLIHKNISSRALFQTL